MQLEIRMMYDTSYVSYMQYVIVCSGKQHEFHAKNTEAFCV